MAQLGQTAASGHHPTCTAGQSGVNGNPSFVKYLPSSHKRLCARSQESTVLSWRCPSGHQSAPPPSPVGLLLAKVLAASGDLVFRPLPTEPFPSPQAAPETQCSVLIPSQDFIL